MKEEKLKEVHALLGRTKLSKNEQWMFDNYWNYQEYRFGKCGQGKLSVHKVDK